MVCEVSYLHPCKHYEIISTDVTTISEAALLILIFYFGQDLSPIKNTGLLFYTKGTGLKQLVAEQCAHISIFLRLFVKRWKVQQRRNTEEEGDGFLLTLLAAASPSHPPLGSRLSAGHPQHLTQFEPIYISTFLDPKFYIQKH